VPVDSGRVHNTGLPAKVSDTDIAVGRPLSNVGSRTSQTSLLRKAAMNDVRRAFFSSPSSASSLADGTDRLKTKDSEDALQTSCGHEFAAPISDRSLLMLWLDQT